MSPPMPHADVCWPTSVGGYRLDVAELFHITERALPVDAVTGVLTVRRDSAGRPVLPE
jgi:hypothetical protein